MSLIIYSLLAYFVAFDWCRTHKAPQPNACIEEKWGCLNKATDSEYLKKMRACLLEKK